MSTPLGLTAGNALEVRESVEVLEGGGPADVVALTVALAREMLAGAGVDDVDPAEVLASGGAMDSWRRMIAAQGGDPSAALPTARETHVVTAPASGVLTRLDAMAVGLAAWRLGAGRAKQGDAVQAGAGVEWHARPGDTVSEGAPLLTLHTDEPDRFERALASLEGGYDVTPDAAYEAEADRPRPRRLGTYDAQHEAGVRCGHERPASGSRRRDARAEVRRTADLRAVAAPRRGGHAPRWRCSAYRSTRASATAPARGSARSTSGRARGCCVPTTRRRTSRRSARCRSPTPVTSGVNPFDLDEAIASIEEGAGAVLEQAGRLLTIGGDHTIALPLLRCMAAKHGPVAVLHFDAHLDTWDTYFGAPYTHGTPFRRASEEGLIDSARSLHVGIRGPLYADTDLEESTRLGYATIACTDYDRLGLDGVIAAMLSGSTRDRSTSRSTSTCSTPAQRPGTGTPEAGGLSSRELLATLRALGGVPGLDVVSADVVEVAPAYDHAEITGIAAAHVAYELLGVMARSGS